MVDTIFATLNCSVGNTVGPIDLKFYYNLRITELYRMQKSCIRISGTVVEI
ncbi:hypothetical protein O3M35_001374 [Rhynocoris fuscipes]|uniref:Uncharacterized protein n=1 Tax=Rhynocoris fuscipes TaxID=488301 RepID=A0AAW1CNY5_9HEMI